MDASVKLKELLPMFRSVFPPEDVNALVDELKNEESLKWKETKTLHNTIDEIISIVSSAGIEAILAFKFAIQSFGKISLSKLTEKFINNNTDDLIHWLIINWGRVISCSSALEGLQDYVTGISVDDHITSDQWVEILYEISCADQESVKYFVLQIIQNVAFDEIKSSFDASSFLYLFKIFKPIIKPRLKKKDYIAIAKHLEEGNGLSKDDAKTLRCSQQPFDTFVDLISENPREKCLLACVKIIRDKGFVSLANILDRFFKYKNRKLLWLLVHWSKLDKQRTSIFEYARQRRFFSQQKVSQGNAWFIDLMLQIATDDNDRTDKCMGYLLLLVGTVKIVVRPQETKSESVKAESTTNKEDPVIHDLSCGLRSNDKAGAEPKDQHTETTGDIKHDSNFQTQHSESTGQHSKQDSNSQTQHSQSTRNIKQNSNLQTQHSESTGDIKQDFNLQTQHSESTGNIKQDSNSQTQLSESTGDIKQDSNPQTQHNESTGNIKQDSNSQTQLSESTGDIKQDSNSQTQHSESTRNIKQESNLQTQHSESTGDIKQDFNLQTQHSESTGNIKQDSNSQTQLSESTGDIKQDSNPQTQHSESTGDIKQDSNSQTQHSESTGDIKQESNPQTQHNESTGNIKQDSNSQTQLSESTGDIKQDSNLQTQHSESTRNIKQESNLQTQHSESTGDIKQDSNPQTQLSESTGDIKQDSNPQTQHNESTGNIKQDSNSQTQLSESTGDIKQDSNPQTQHSESTGDIKQDFNLQTQHSESTGNIKQDSNSQTQLSESTGDIKQDSNPQTQHSESTGDIKQDSNPQTQHSESTGNIKQDSNSQTQLSESTGDIKQDSNPQTQLSESTGNIKQDSNSQTQLSESTGDIKQDSNPQTQHNESTGNIKQDSNSQTQHSENTGNIKQDSNLQTQHSESTGNIKQDSNSQTQQNESTGDIKQDSNLQTQHSESTGDINQDSNSQTQHSQNTGNIKQESNPQTQHSESTGNIKQDSNSQTQQNESTGDIKQDSNPQTQHSESTGDINQDSNSQTQLSESTGDSVPEQFAAFHLVVDKNYTLPTTGKMHVFIDRLNKFISLHSDPERNKYYGSMRWDLCNKTLVYKYVWTNVNGEKVWEQIPSHGTASVNRKFEIKQEAINNNCIHLYDVAKFAGKNGSLSDFTSMYSRNINRYLPKIAHMQLGKETHSPMNISSCLVDLEAWWKYAKIGFTFDECNSSRPKLLASCRSELLEYVNNYADYKSKDGSSFEVSQRVLTILAVLMHIERNQIEYPADSQREKFLRNLCIALSPHEIHENDMKLLYEEISSPLMMKEVYDGILVHIRRVEDPLHSLQLLPLYYMIKNKGSFTIDETVWMETCQEFDLNQQNLNESSDLTGVVPFIVNVSKSIPSLIGLFQSMLPLTVVLHLLNQSQDVIKQVLKPCSFLIALLSSMKTDKFEQFFESNKLCGWILSYLNEVAKKCQSHVLEQKDASDIAEINDALVKFMNGKSNLTNWKPSAVSAFFRIAVKVQACYSHLLECQSYSRETLKKTIKVLLHHIQVLIASDISVEVTRNSFEMWNFLLNGQISDSELNMDWKSVISKAIQDNVHKKLVSEHSKILQTFESVLNEWESSLELQACYSEVVFTYAMDLNDEKGLNWIKKVVNRFKRSKHQQNGFFSVFQRMFLDSWQKCLNNAPNDHTSAVLTFVQSSPLVVHFLNLFDDQEKKKLLKDDVKKPMKEILNGLLVVESKLQSGQALYQHINIILNSKMKFEEVFAFTHREVESSSKMLIRREEEMVAYQNTQKTVLYLVNLVANNGSDLLFDLDSLKVLLEKDLTGVSWCDIVDLNWDSPENIDVVLFGVSSETKTALDEIYQYKIDENEIIRDFWVEQAAALIANKKDSDDNSLSKLRICDIDELWKVVKKHGILLKHQIVSGSLVLHEVERLFGKYENKYLEDIVNRLVQGIYAFPRQDDSATAASEGSLKVEFEVNDEIQEEDIEWNSEIKEEYLESNDSTDNDLEFIYSSTWQEEAFQEDIDNDEGEASSTKQFEIINADDAEEDGVNKSQQSMQSNAPRSVEQPDKQEADEDPTADDHFELRVDQICKYFSLQRNKDIAATFHHLKECLGLEGDFSYSDIVQEQKDLAEERHLKSITREVLKISEKIEIIQVGDIELVKNFLEHEELIHWLRDNMDDRGAVKVMSDLAMTSAGENVKEVDMVSCFLSAVMGFAPFIFDLRKDDDLNATFAAFEKVKQASDQAKLKTKWDATADNLEWLKSIKDFHGSVEKTSLARARDINCRGIYTIGGEAEKIPTIENALRLELAGTKDTDQKQLTLDDLRSLESRLMLIAGKAEKGCDDGKVFIGTLALVENMGKVYVKLKTAGCLLFNNWIATVRCVASSDEDNIESSSIEIRFDEHSPRMVTFENVNEELKLLTAVMESVYGRWLSSLGDKRKQFYQLNYFNIKQIMYLCQELAKVVQDNTVSDQVLTLLEFVKPNIEAEELITLLSEAANHKDEVDPESFESIEDDTTISQSEQKRRMVRRLVEESVSEKLAKASVQDCEFPLNYDDCIMKALELESTQYMDDDVVDCLVRDFDKDASFDASTSDVKVIHSVVNDRSPLTLQTVIREIMESKQDERSRASVVVKTVCERYLTATAVTSLNDCISIERLGILLENLFSKNEMNFQLQREFPETFEEAKPNLVICPEHEMFSTLLSLYMQSPKQPLPSLSEVLLCSESTSSEDVELFLRRAINENPRLGACIFTLAFAHKLSFEVANAANRMIKELEKEPDYNPRYRLVVLCSSSQHYIASLLLENRVDYAVRLAPDEARTYLSSHLKLHECHQTVLSIPNHFQMKTSVLAVTSERAGMGKSLHIERWRERLPSECRNVIIRLLDKQLSEDKIMAQLLPDNETITNARPHFIHFDITPSKFFLDQIFIGLLPTVRCLSPLEILDLESSSDDGEANVMKMDLQHFESDVFQRSYQYLEHYHNGQSLDRFRYDRPVGSPSQCIKTLLKACMIKNPTWSELRHFASFLNNQLGDCEESIFCNEAIVVAGSGLEGFKNFVVKFMIRMSQDFATPSSVDGDGSVIRNDRVFERHQLRRHWEENVHPYLFFNEDRVSMTFLNLFVDRKCNLADPKDPLVILEQGFLTQGLLKGLKRQRVNLNQNFDALSREDKLVTLCRVMGLDEDLDDPDPTYELTTDNVLKLLAIHMRFRCGIPVVIMGETGCGKTRMVEFMSKLKSASKIKTEDKKADATARMSASALYPKPEPKLKSIQNMMIVKVHGGITVSVIQEKMREAVKLARYNEQTHQVDTILFLDEANTTEAIYAIKEYVCDGTINGEQLQGSSLKVICACNPYRKHDEGAIRKMAEAGLGFRVKNEDTTDKLGNIPMRCLVYRVIALPPSMHPLVWDFGQLSEEAENIYIQQMVLKLSRVDLPTQFDIKLLVDVLCASQNYMRRERSQCLFVSLRDVERCLNCFLWFYRNGQWLYEMIDHKRSKKFPNYSSASGSVLRALIHAIGMCYHVTLEERSSYRQHISTCLHQLNCTLSADDMLDEIVVCQSVFSESLDLEDNIARNEALRENSFMIAMCTEMRIPLFLIGKPGSSKSLAKTVVTDAMQGPNSKSEVFQKLKQIHVLSFQCSAVSDAVGIEAVFTQCAQVQAGQDPEKFVSVVVLDEVGLAEDSPKMPLKVLHPLLEGSSIASVMKQAHTSSASQEAEKPISDNTISHKSENTGTTSAIEKESTLLRRVGFVGISNWALDPAKMNRGIFVIRGDPTENDLKQTATGIFPSDGHCKFTDIGKIVHLLTSSYLEIRKKQEQEFFGLRDYYGLLKMIFAVVKKTDVALDYFHVSDAIKRNFSGGRTDCFDIFLTHLKDIWSHAEKSTVSIKKMICDNLKSVCECESRFLLLLTNRFAAVNLIVRIIKQDAFQIIFGSSFPGDNDYTELCRNINKIKICMESGCTVVLLNLRDLYESLYDALNQHYLTFAGQRYVDLGLGGHRVKCRVAKEFRLIVIEDKDVVYDEFPIPLINRLEKYVFTSESILDGDELQVAHRLRDWIENFAELDIPMHKRRMLKQFVAKQCFPGYNEDSAASAVLNANDSDDSQKLAQLALLNTATVDSVFRLQNSQLKKEALQFQKQYFFDQSHDNLVSFMKQVISEEYDALTLRSFAFEVTSYSQILSEHDRQTMEQALGLPKNSIMLLTLQQFKTQDEYNVKLGSFFEFSLDNVDSETNTFPVHVLLIQCTQAQKHSNLIACARFCVKNKVQDLFLSKAEDIKAKIFIAFLYNIDRQSDTNKTGFSFHSSDFISVFVDELRPTVNYMGPPSLVFNKSIGEVFQSSVESYKYKASELPSMLLDPIKLVRDSVSGAIVKLKARVEKKERNRVQILHALLRGEHPAAAPFQNIILKRISQLLNERDRNVPQPLAWSIKEACSQESLYEGGTFSKTLWLRLKRLVTFVLAKIISVLDEDNNLDILYQGNPQDALFGFWLACFENADDVCKFNLKEVLSICNEYDVRGGDFSCRFPFSRRVSECFARLWNALQDCPVEQKLALFYNKVSGLKISDIVTDVFSNKQMSVLKQYTHDLVRLQFKVPHINEFELVEDALISQFVIQHRSSSNDGAVSSNFLAVLYSIFASNELQLQQMHAVFELHPSLLTESNLRKWKAEQNSCEIILVHVLAYQDALIHVENHFDKFTTSKGYHTWKNMLRKILNLKVDISALKTQTDPLLKIHRNISSICIALSFVDLFLSVLMPEDVSDEDFEHYLSILVPLAKRLSKGAKITGLTNAKFLKILMDILRSCSKELYLKLLLSWKDLSCKYCQKSKVIEPVILPCGHYFCKKCINIVTKSSPNQCPMCRQNFPDDFEVKASKLSKEKIEEYDDFKRNCTSFFLQYLSTLCFPAANDPTSDSAVNPEIWNYLQNLVIRENDTREMTPMDMESFDETPTVRSFIVQLLLRYNQENTQELLESHFKKMEKVLGDMKDLMAIYIRCVEDSLQVRANNAKIMGPPTYQQYVEELVQHTKDEFDILEDESRIKVLNAVATVRFIIRLASRMIHDVYSSNLDEATTASAKGFLRSVCDLLERFNIPMARKYFVKNLCRRFGFNDFQQLINENEFSSLIPPEINPRDLDNLSTQKSSFYVLGDDFAKTQSELLSVESEDDFDSCIDTLSETAADSNDAAVQVLHAVQSWMNATNSDEGKSLRQDFLTKLIQELETHNVSKNMLNDFVALINTKPYQAITSLEISEYTAFTLQEFVWVAGSTIASASGNILEDLQQMIRNPQSIGSLFLPTMPHSGYFDVKHIVSQLKEQYSKSPKAYLCPNKHIYFIGDCTNPNQSGTCPECRKPIGGRPQQSSQLEADNVAGELDESSQAGYLLGEPQHRTSVTPERNCTRLVVSTIRMFLHAAMIHAARNGDSIMRHLKLNDEDSTVAFLFHHLRIDFNQFIDCLGKSAEDGVLLLHQIMKNMRTAGNMARSYSSTLTTFEEREVWEGDFQQSFLSRIFERTDEAIDEARKICCSAQKQNDLERLVYEIPVSQSDEEEMAPVSMDMPCLWNYQINVTLAHLRQTLEGVAVQEKRKFEILKLVLNEGDLGCVQHVLTILSLQHSLIQRYQRKVDASDVEKTLISDYCEEEDRVVTDASFQLYINVWNTVNKNLPYPTVYDISKEELHSEMHMDSPIAMCLPSKVGRGRCALIMIEYLVEKQNQLLNKCKEVLDLSFTKVSADQLSLNDLICIDDDQSLMPLVLSNSQYEVTIGETGTKHRIVYRLPALEKQIIEKFIVNRKLIDGESLPQIKYLQDMGLGVECQAMQNNVTQVPLPPNIVEKVNGLCRKCRLSDICEGVRTLALVISYLAKLESDGTRHLVQYITEELLIPAEETSMIPSSAQLQHTLALYECLSYQRSMRFVASGQDPFANVTKAVNVEDDEEGRVNEKDVKAFLRGVDVPSMQLELNSMILLKQGLDPFSSLRDNLIAYVEEKFPDYEKSKEVIKMCGNLPDKLLVLDAPRVFRLTVDFAV